MNDIKKREIRHLHLKLDKEFKQEIDREAAKQHRTVTGTVTRYIREGIDRDNKEGGNQ